MTLASCSSSNRACKLCIVDDDCNAGYTCEEFTDRTYRCAKPGIDCEGVFPLAPSGDEEYIVVDLDHDSVPDLLHVRAGQWQKGAPNGEFDAPRQWNAQVEN